MNWIPLGGFVKIAGESEFLVSIYNKNKKRLDEVKIQKKLKEGESLYFASGKELSKAERKLLSEQLQLKASGENFYSKSLLAKTLVLAAGVIMNFLLAGIIFSFLFFIGMKPLGINTIIPTSVDSELIPTYEGAIKNGLLIENE